MAWFFYLVCSIGMGFWLLSWPVRKRKAGHLLLNAGRTWHNKMLFWIGIAEIAVAAVITWVSVVTLTDLPDISSAIAPAFTKISFWWMVALFIVSVGLNKLELRENGLCFLYTAIPWRRMTSYTWETSYPDILTIRVQPRLLLLPRLMRIRIPAAHRHEIDRIVQTYIARSGIGSRTL